MEWAVILSIPPAEMSSPVGSCGRQVLARRVFRSVTGVPPQTIDVLLTSGTGGT